MHFWTSPWMDALPFWMVFVASVLLLNVSCELGYHFGQQVRRATGKTPSSSLAGGSLSAVLGLLAIMLAFTFNMAEKRFGDRKELVVTEANCIGTAYLRANFLPEPTRTSVRDLLQQYVDLRLELAEGANLDQVPEFLLRSEQIQGDIWAEMVTVAAMRPGSHPVALAIAAVNDVIDVHSKRVAKGLRNRIPEGIWWTLYLVALMSTGLMGFLGGTQGTRSAMVALALMVTFSAVMMLIMDLDRPIQHLFSVSQQAMVDLQRSLDHPGT